MLLKKIKNFFFLMFLFISLFVLLLFYRLPQHCGKPSSQPSRDEPLLLTFLSIIFLNICTLHKSAHIMPCCFAIRVSQLQPPFLEFFTTNRLEQHNNLYLNYSTSNSRIMLTRYLIVGVLHTCYLCKKRRRSCQKYCRNHF